MRFLPVFAIALFGCDFVGEVDPDIACSGQCDEDQSTCYDDCEVECEEGDDPSCDADCTRQCDDDFTVCTGSCGPDDE